PASSEDEDQNAASEGQPEDNSLSMKKFSASERAEIARKLGIAFDKTGTLNDALFYLQSAYRLETDSAAKKQINQEVQKIRLLQRRRAANANRQPQIHSALEQEHTVRSRLSEQAVSSPPRPQGPVRKGVAQ